MLCMIKQDKIKKMIKILLVGLLLQWGYLVNAQQYESNWNSLDQHPIPEWFEDAKLGIFIHWGPYSVPA